MARILIIEDSPTDTRVFTSLLERNGHEVIAAGSAEDGIDMAKSQKPDLVLMDVILPGMNGFQATRALSKDPGTSSIPVIIVSTKGMETDRVWGMRQGAKDYVVKPPNEKDLIQRISTALGQS
ncbi:response regulator [Alkalisalibacterium limincola]|uniref:Response regulator n=1 Tax=Alkalisalibacterium limincola TaxID=2699169 RepID=A0A5C8KPE5_9GAMM|nr:response regulator [Alkalisalibacterium limincola]TXK62682.1 response regulator [Alkalisalibacterium limincola]